MSWKTKFGQRYIEKLHEELGKKLKKIRGLLLDPMNLLESHGYF